MISDMNFFVKTKSFLFSPLCIVGIKAYKSVIQILSEYDWFYVSKIQLYIKYMLYKMMIVVNDAMKILYVYIY